MTHKSSCLAMLLTGVSLSASAVELQDGRLQLHGFASQAVVETSGNRFFGDSDSTSFDFTELGLNVSYQVSNGILLSSQVLLRRAGEMYDGSPSLDYALIDATLAASEDHRLGIRLGRIKNPLGLYNETRDVPFTRPGIFLPQAVYFDKLRNLMLSSDGLMLYDEHFWDFGTLSLVLGGGQTVVDDNVEWGFLGGDFAGKLEPEGPVWLASAWMTDPAERLKLGLSLTTSSFGFDASRQSILGSGSIDFFYTVASAQYNAEHWTLSAEYARMPLEWRNFGPYFPFDKETIEGYYVQGEYRVTSSVGLMARYEEGFADRHDRSGRRASALTGGTTPDFDFYSKIWTLGLRWDVSPNLMLRLEYQHHDGTFALSIRENPDPGDLVRDWDVLAASISLRF